MLLLITGASGVGKTSARIAIEGELGAAVECVELHHVLPPSSPAQMNRVWRQHAAEVAVGRAIELQTEGRHLLLAGDPVPAIEIVAAPSSPGLNAVAVCLLHADPDAQAARLAERGDHAGLALLPDHQAFADWMRCQATDPVRTSHGPQWTVVELSTVDTSAPSSWPAGTRHAQTVRPPGSTVHEPQAPR